jgi:tRNA modification GTPase
MPTRAECEVCVLTPPGRGAVAVIAIAGPTAAHALSQYFLSSSALSPSRLRVQRIYHGHWADEQGEEVVVCRTALEEFEIHCHGGLAAVNRIVGDLERAGAIRFAESDWLTRRGMTVLQRDAWQALSAARTERTANILLDQWNGALDAAIAEILADCHRHDFGQAKHGLQSLFCRAALGRHLIAPFNVVLAGPPNVGKSSLINALVGYSRAIVYDAPGTTRDVITADTAIDGWPVTLSDTAGLRESHDPLEAAGVQSALARLRDADLVVLLFDAGQAVALEQQRLMSEFPAALIVLTKCDLPHETRQFGATGNMLRTSAVTGNGIPELLAAISHRLVPDPPAAGAAVPFLATHSSALERALAAMERSDALLAIELLSALVARLPA